MSEAACLVLLVSHNNHISLQFVLHVLVPWGRGQVCGVVGVGVGHQGFLLPVVDDNNFNQVASTGVASAAVAVVPNPEEADQLTEQHADGAGHQAANDPEEGRDDEEAQGLV